MPGDAPERIELPLAVRFEISAQAAVVVLLVRIGIGVLDLAVGEEPSDLKCADLVEMTVLGVKRGPDAGVQVRRQREVSRDTRSVGS